MLIGNVLLVVIYWHYFWKETVLQMSESFVIIQYHIVANLI